MKSLLTPEQVNLTIQRLAHQIIENHLDLDNTVLIGLQPRGIFVSNRIVEVMRTIIDKRKIQYGKLDITFYRDDIRSSIHMANETEINFSIENKSVVLIDDVLWTGRTIRAALDALLDFGRPASVELCVLIDRRFTRQLPIQPNYTGRAIDTYDDQKVKVYWEEKDGRNAVELLTIEDAAQ